MPWSAAAHAFFGLCAGKNRDKAIKKCPPKKDALRMVREGIKKPKR